MYSILKVNDRVAGSLSFGLLSTISMMLPGHAYSVIIPDELEV
jgi:hypothetical protein